MVIPLGSLGAFWTPIPRYGPSENVQRTLGVRPKEGATPPQGPSSRGPSFYWISNRVRGTQEVTPGRAIWQVRGSTEASGLSCGASWGALPWSCNSLGNLIQREGPARVPLGGRLPLSCEGPPEVVEAPMRARMAAEGSVVSGRIQHASWRGQPGG